MPEYSNQNSTSERDARERINRIQLRLKENGLISLAEKVKDRSARILEVGTGYGTFLYTLLEMGFTNVRGLDDNPAHFHKFPELDSIIDIETLGMLRTPKEPYDIVVSNLVFDEGLYREQESPLFREYMLRGIYSQLKHNGVYYASEVKDTHKIKDAIKRICPIQATLLGNHSSELIRGIK